MAATWLADALRAGGLTVDESLVPNWKTRGHTDGPFTPVGVLGHHTAGATTGNLPSLGIVRDGRPDLAGPLANLMLARNGVWVPIAAGRAWHAGAADHPANFPWVPHGDGNGYLIGIEAESCGTCDDWTPQQRASYPKGVAALLRHMGVGTAHFLGHKEWAPSRKVDPAFWDLNAFRRDVTTALTPTPTPAVDLSEEDDMPYIIKADKKPSAVLVGGLFLGLPEGTDEEKNWLAAGAKVVWVTPLSWDAFAAGNVLGQPQRLGTQLAEKLDKLTALLTAQAPAAPAAKA